MPRAHTVEITFERFGGGFESVDFTAYSKVKNPQLKRYDFGFAQLLEATR